MADTAAHLVDCVLPEVPVRRWDLTASSHRARARVIASCSGCGRRGGADGARCYVLATAALASALGRSEATV